MRWSIECVLRRPEIMKGPHSHPFDTKNPFESEWLIGSKGSVSDRTHGPTTDPKATDAGRSGAICRDQLSMQLGGSSGFSTITSPSVFIIHEECQIGLLG